MLLVPTSPGDRPLMARIAWFIQQTRRSRSTTSRPIGARSDIRAASVSLSHASGLAGLGSRCRSTSRAATGEIAGFPDQVHLPPNVETSSAHTVPKGGIPWHG